MLLFSSSKFKFKRSQRLKSINKYFFKAFSVLGTTQPNGLYTKRKQMIFEALQTQSAKMIVVPHILNINLLQFALNK